jgi:hypothetical protein
VFLDRQRSESRSSPPDASAVRWAAQSLLASHASAVTTLAWRFPFAHQMATYVTMTSSYPTWEGILQDDRPIGKALKSLDVVIETTV